MLNWNRRQFLSGLLTAASAGAATSVQAMPLPTALAPDATTATPSLPSNPHLAGVGTTTPASALPEMAARGLRELLPEGVRFGRWRVVSVLPVKLGAVPVVLETRRGERFQVDILRRDRSTRARRGLSETRDYSLFLLNRGHGGTPTQEDHGLAVLWLAAFLRPRERTHFVADLLTQRERTQRFPRGKFNALVADAVPETTRFEASPSEATWSFPHGEATADKSEPAPPAGSDPLPSRPV